MEVLISIGLSATNPIGVNLFAYCNNNPVMYSDPNGYGSVGAIIGAILGFGLGALILPYIADLLDFMDGDETYLFGQV